VTAASRKPRLAVVSPFLDKRHGTERRAVEWVCRLADIFEIHVYSQDVKDLNLSRIFWHRIPKLPGPHLLNFLWWFAANHLWRAWDRSVRGLRQDILFSPGVNCFRADAVSVHIVFAEYMRKNKSDLSLARSPVWLWPRILHRRLYYNLLISLEHRVYTRRETALILIARRTGIELAKYYGRGEGCPVVYVGLDHAAFNPQRRTGMREEARRDLGIPGDRFVVLLVGNDWRNKGVPVLLEAISQLEDLPVDLLVVSQENQAPLPVAAYEKGIKDRVRVLPPRRDVEFYYAAADAYAGPSLEDTFAQPPAEAMACGLPVIVSAANGASEIITHRVDGLILDDPTNATALAEMIRELCQDGVLRSRLGERAAETARQYTWERNAREIDAIFQEILRRKAGAAQSLARER